MLGHVTVRPTHTILLQFGGVYFTMVVLLVLYIRRNNIINVQVELIMNIYKHFMTLDYVTNIHQNNL